jgi:resuscitation-promoting factor RpfB
MFEKFKGWHSGLSKVGKVTVWTLSGALAVMAIGAANPTPTAQEKTTTPQVQVESSQKTETKTVTETAEIPFTSTTVEDGNLAKGQTAIRTAGVNGVKTLTYTVTYTDGQETSKKIAKEEITTAPVAQVTAVGTYVKPQNSCDPNYTPCVPLVSYDLDCPDIGFRVTVVGYDKHGFDGNDNDGLGCESY